MEIRTDRIYEERQSNTHLSRSHCYISFLRTTLEPVWLVETSYAEAELRSRMELDIFQ